MQYFFSKIDLYVNKTNPIPEYDLKCQLKQQKSLLLYNYYPLAKILLFQLIILLLLQTLNDITYNLLDIKSDYYRLNKKHSLRQTKHKKK